MAQTFMPSQADGIFDLIYSYYPRKIYTSQDSYFESEEFNRRSALCIANFKKENALNLGKFLKHSFREYNIEYIFIPTHGPCHSYRIHWLYADSISQTLVLSISLLGDYYCIYNSILDYKKSVKQPAISWDFNHEEQKLILASINDGLMNFFPGYQRVDKDFALTTVPDVFSSINSDKHATIFECLFSDHMW